MWSLYAALQRLLQFSRTSPGEERAELMDWHLHVEPLEQLQRAQDQLHQEPLEREQQEQFLQMDHEAQEEHLRFMEAQQQQDHQDLDQHLDDHHQDHRDDQHDPQDPFW